MSIKRFNPTLCRGRVWGVINITRAAQRGLTWALGSTIEVGARCSKTSHQRIAQPDDSIIPPREPRHEHTSQHRFREMVLHLLLRSLRDLPV